MKLILVLSVLSISAMGMQWGAHELSLKNQIQKIRDKETKLSELVALKDSEKDNNKIKELLSEIAKEYKELETLYKELEEEKRHVRFEHPDKGMDIERKYSAYKIKSIEEIHSENGTDGRLSRLKAKILKKYSKTGELPNLEAPKREPASVEEETKVSKPATEKPKNPILSPKLSY